MNMPWYVGEKYVVVIVVAGGDFDQYFEIMIYHIFCESLIQFFESTCV